MSGAISGGVIGGAFPLLFGQSGAAATGGAIGGVAGGLLGPGGSFAGSLLGTLIGQAAGQGNQIKELAADIGLSAQQTQVLAAAFKQAGADFDKFAESVSRIQGVTDDVETQARAIQLASTLTEVYGGKIDKVTNAFTSALQSGKVTQATLNQLTSQGIPIQEALANKYDVSRSKLLQMAKDGQISVQDLIDTLVKVGNEGSASADKQSDAFKEGFAKIEEAAFKLGATLVSVFATSGATMEDALGSAIRSVTGYLADFINGIEVLVRVAGPALNSVIGWYVGIQTAIFKAVNAVPGLTDAIITFAIAATGPLAGVIAQMQTIAGLGAGAGGKERQGPYLPDRLKKAPLKSFNVPSQFVPTGGGGAGKKAGGADDAERIKQRVAELQRETALTQQLGFIKENIANAEAVRDKETVIRLQGEEKILQIQYRLADSLAQSKDKAVAIALTAKAQVDVDNTRLETVLSLSKLEEDRQTKLDELLLGFDREIELAAIKDEAAKNLRQIEFDIIDLRKEGILLTETEVEAYRRRAQAATGDTAETPAQKIYSQMQKDLEELIAIENVARDGAKGIGDAFGVAFQDILSGSASAQEALAGMMKSIGENFLSMAAQIIAQQVTMIIFGTIMKALGVSMPGGGGGGGFGGAPSAPSVNYGFTPSFGSGFGARANGGPVFANAPYVVGEQGPELFTPAMGGTITSNRDLRSAMNAGGGGAAGAPVLNMSFETTNIGGVEYVSRDQLEQAMAETRRNATRDGAQRGMSMTLDKLQQSPSTRRRIGV
jgi:tape measure domain-containing protein